MKPIYWLLILLGFTENLSAQTALFGGANGNGNFENGTTDWVIVNGSQTNKWVVSNNATPGFTGNCIYISSSSAAPYAHNYNVSASTYSYFYKDVPIPAGTKTAWLVFDYISKGHWVTDQFGTIVDDGLRIYARNTSTVITPGDELPGNFFLSGAYYNQPTWLRKQVRYLDATTYAGSTMRVIFQWNNDNASGNQPPAGIDNIEMYASCQEMLYPTQDFLHTDNTSAGIVWNTQTGATGYDIRYRKIDDPLTVATYTNPVNVPGNSSYSYTIPNLTQATTYLVEIRPAGLPCTEFSAHARITTTCTPPAQPTISAAGNLLTTASGLSSYQWYLNNSPINGATTNQYTVLQSGVYKVEVGNADGCKISSADFNFVTTAVNDIQWEGQSIRLYPNPVHDQLKINLTGSTLSKNITAQLVDINGRILQTHRLKAGMNNLDLNNLPQGMYSVIIKNGVSEKTIRIIRFNQ